MKTYRVLGPSRIADTDIGETFQKELRPGTEKRLLDRGLIEVIDPDEPTDDTPTNIDTEPESVETDEQFETKPNPLSVFGMGSKSRKED